MNLELEKQSTCSVADWNELNRKKSFIKLSRAVINYLLADRSIAQTDKLVWLFLSMSSLVNLKIPEVQFSTSEIGKWVNRSNNTITKSLNTLVKAGYIKLKEPLRSKKLAEKHKITILFPKEDWNSICKEKSFIKLPWCTFTYLLKDEKLSQTNKFVWLSLLSYTFTNPDTRELKFSSAQIGRMMNRTRSPISRSLKSLVEAGYIQLENPLRSNQSNDRHKITVLFPNQAIQTFKMPLNENESVSSSTSADKSQLSSPPLKRVSDSIVATPSKNNVSNKLTIFFGVFFLILHGLTQILHGVTRKMHTYNKISSIRSFILDNIVNRVKAIPKFTSQSITATTVKNVFFEKTNRNKEIDDPHKILIRAGDINTRFHSQLKKGRELELSFSMVIKQADEELSNEERHLLTQAACIAYVRHELLCFQYQVNGSTKEDSESKAFADLSLLEQDLLKEYQCKDAQYQTRLNRCEMGEIVRKMIELPQLPSFNDKINYLENLYQEYEHMYHEKSKDGVDADTAKQYVFRLLTKEKIGLFLEVAEAVCNQVNQEAKKLSKQNGKNFNTSYEESKKNLSSFEQKLFLEYTGDPRGTLLGLRDLSKVKAHETSKNSDPVIKPSNLAISFVQTPSQAVVNVDISSDMLSRIIGWLYTMRKKGQISKNTTHKEMERLIEEVAYHAIHWRPTSEKYRNMDEIEKMKIAISIACRAIRNDKWKTPYGLNTQKSIQRELEAQTLKDKYMKPSQQWVA